MNDPITLPFNPDGMTIRDMKAAVQCLRGILKDYDNFNDLPEEFALRVLQVRNNFTVE